jgi:putative DNA methylase
MTPKDCKRLAEVGFPISLASRHAAREKFIRHGPLCTLHLRWIQLPLVARRVRLIAWLLLAVCGPHSRTSKR